MNCTHWKDKRCELGLYGGRPSPGVCRQCPQRDPPAQPTADPRAEAEYRKRLAGCKGCGDSPLEG